MNWDVFGHIADILGVISFFFSLVSLIFSWLILSRIKRQRSQFNKERMELYESLCALRVNIWSDQLTDARICDKLQTELLGYRMRYGLLLSPRCRFHLNRCINLLARADLNPESKIIRNDLNFLIARLTKKE